MHLRSLVIAMTVFTAVVHAQAPALRSPVPGAPAAVTAFINVTVVPMDTARILPGQTVLVQHGWITAVGPVGQVKVPAGAVRIDAKGRVLMPGLGDMHAHIQVASEVYGETDSAQAENRLLHLWLANGVTTIRNLDYSQREGGERALRLKIRAAAGELLSPHVYTAGPWTGMDEVEAFRRVKAEQVASLVAAYKAAGYDFIKVHEEHGREFWDSLAAAARRQGVPIVGHPPRERSFGRRMWDWGLAAPMKSVEHIHVWPLADTSVELPTVAAATRRAGTWICPTVVVEKTVMKFPSAAVSRFIKTFHDSGVGLLLGTDDYKEVPVTVHDELRTLVEDGGLTPYQALLTGTRNIAAYFGTLNETGTVAVGKRADLVLLRGNPLEDIRNTAEPIGTMIGGRWITRAEVAPRWVGLQRRAAYQEYLQAHMSLMAMMKGISLTEEQQTRLQQGNKAFHARRRALLDSLVSVVDTAAGRARLLRLVAQRFGDYRTMLTPEQQAVFDANARPWIQQYQAQGYQLEIPGVKP